MGCNPGRGKTATLNKALTSRLRSALRIGPPLLAAAMMALTLTPAEIWSGTPYDAVYSGFDPNLLSVTGDVRVTRDNIDMTAGPNDSTSVSFVTTLRRRIVTDVVVTPLTKASAPFRIGAWSPWTGTGYFIVLGADPEDQIEVQAIRGGTASASLVGGIIDSQSIGRYQLGQNYRVRFLIDRAVGDIQASVSGPGVLESGPGRRSTATLTKSQSPALFTNVQMSVTASLEPGQGTSSVALTSYHLALPHERAFATRSSWIAAAIEIALLVIGLLLFVIAAILGWPLWRGLRSVKVSKQTLGLALGVAIIYVAGNVPLFVLGGHPFDFGSEKLYAYVARTYGPDQLYFLPPIVAAASGPGAIPWLEAAFPYEAVFAYLSTGIGWAASFLGGSAAVSRNSDLVGYIIKSVNVVFGLADGFLVYAILRRLDVGERWSRVGSALFLLNPAVWFSMSVWGQTHVVSIFFVLMAIWFAERSQPTGAWLFLFAALLTRPQMLVFGLLLGVVFLKKFRWPDNLKAISWSIIVTFLVLAPLTLATSPSLPVDVMLNDLRIQQAGGNQAALTTVSQGAFSLWPLITYITQSASSVGRSFTPSATFLIGSLTYQSVSQILTSIVLILLAVVLLRRRRTDFAAGAYIPIVAVGVMSFHMLLTGIVATSFLLALPMLLLCKRWMDSVAYLYVAAIWTISTLVPMYGEMGAVISGDAYPLLAPANNPVTRLFVGLYEWDRFITVAVVANICAVIWLAYLSLRPSSSYRRLPAA